MRLRWARWAATFGLWLVLCLGGQPAALAQGGSGGVPADPAAQRQRLALVVGMGTVGKRIVLESARRDSAAVAGALRAGGFEVTLLEDSNSTDLRAALKDYRERLRPDGVGLIYYTGLGAQVDGRNLLLPSEVALTDTQPPAGLAAMLRAVGLPLQELVEALAGGTDAPRALVVDAAYRHPALGRLTPAGLARPRLGSNTLVLMGHAPGALQELQVAPAPAEPASDPRQAAATRFARVLVEALSTPRITLPEALRAVRLSVVDSSGGQTQPWLGGETFARVHLADAARLENPAAAALAAAGALAPAAATASVGAVVGTSGGTSVGTSSGASAPDNQTSLSSGGRSATAEASSAAAGSTAASTAASTATSTAGPTPPANKPVPPADGRTTAAPGQGERPFFQARRNPFDHAEGDTLSYHLVDTRKDEVMSSYTVAIDEVKADGHLSANGGQWQLDPQGRIKQLRLEDGTQITFEPAQELWWAKPQAGESRPVAFKETRTQANKPQVQISWRGNAQVGTLRVMETPAGEFEVLPIKTTGQSSLTRAGAPGSNGQFTRTVFYAPKLGMPVAIEIEDNDVSGRSLRRERMELTHAQQARTVN